MEMKKYKFISANEYCVRVFDGTHDSPKPCEKGYKLLTSKNILAGELDKTSAYYISENDYNAINQRSKVQQYDILFSMIGSVGNVCFVKDSNIDFAIKNMGVFSCENKEKALYLYYYLQSPFAKKMIDSYLNGAVQKFLGLERLRNFPILEYSTDKQKIAAVLSSLDDKIALNKKINTKLEAMAKRLYDYWFVQFDYPNGEGKPYKTNGGKMVWNEVLKRKIPEGWEVGGLSDIANITMGQSPEGSSYNGCGNGTIFYQGSTDFGIRFPSVRMYTTAPTRFAKKGDILMSVRAPVGAVNIANTDCCIGRGLSALNSKLGSMTHLYYVIDNFRHTFENKNVAGTTFGSITKDELFELPVAIPDSNILKQFEFVIKQIFDKQMNIGFEIQKLTDLRDRLLPLLMNGQVEVK